MAFAASGVGDLQSELEKAKESLKSVDENIKKLTGRDPAEARALAQQRRNSALGPGPDRGAPEFRPRGIFPGSDRRRDGGLGDGPTFPKRRALGPIHGRMGGFLRRPRDDDSGDEDYPRKPTVQSSVVATLREQKTRNDCIKEQKTDEKGMARNRRMFGLLLGTLQKFRVESQQTQDKEQKRVEIEKKLEAIAEKEKEELRKERQELFQERRRRQAELRRLEFKLELVKQHEEWEKHSELLQNFIRTKTKPHVFYLPHRHNPESEKRLEETRQELEALIVEKRQKMEEEIASLGKRREVATLEVDEGALRENPDVPTENNPNLAIRHKRRRTDEENGGPDDDDDEESGSDEGEIKERVSVEGMDMVGPEESSVGEEGQVLAKEIQTPKVEIDQAGKEEGELLEQQVAAANMAEEEETGKDDARDTLLGVGQEESEPISVAVADVSVVDAFGGNDEAVFAVDILDQTNLAEKEFEPIYD